MRSCRLIVASLIVVAGLAAGTTTTAAAPIVFAPKIVVTPSQHLAPGQVVSVTGTHFAARHDYTIEECSQTRWVVTQRVCNTTQVVHVTTNRAGGFHSKLTVELCPPPPVTAAASSLLKICYVGAPTIHGVDVDSLLGAARITVQVHP
jgi:hypothetical protein